MFVIVLLMGIALQADTPICSGNGDERNCKSEDGSTYIERRLVDQVVREGTAPDGSSYTEYITRVFDGSRLEGGVWMLERGLLTGPPTGPERSSGCTMRAGGGM
jgi:hypothetical protein